MKSRIHKTKECFVCGTTYNIHEHHVFPGRSNRKLSEKYGMKVYLCGYHHNLSNEGVHNNKELDNQLKVMAQEVFEKECGSREDFRSIFGKSYL